MARRRKNRTHAAKADQAKKVNDGTPKSFVVHSGLVGGSVKQLSKDLRRVLEPNTATRLRERKSNKIKDFIAMSGPLGVTHLLVFAQSEANKSAAEDDKEDPASNVNMRITRLPRGPTLGFKVLRYALVRDILAATKRPHTPGKEFQTEPILILNNFSSTNNTADARQLGLMQTMFQNLFPPIKVHSMPLASARRVVLLSYNPETRTIDFRHYLIAVRPVGVSRAVRKLIDGTTARRRPREGSVYSAAASDATTATSASASFAALKARGLPDLRSAQDVSDYVLHHGDLGFLSSVSDAESDASGAESEGEGGEGGESSRHVDLSSAYIGRANRNAAVMAQGGEKRAVKLTELGPRMELGLVKIEDGIGDGKGDVLFHEFIHKTAKEAADIARRAKEREKLSMARRKEQEANVKRKKDAKEKLKAEKKQRRERKEADGEDVDEDEASSGDAAEEDDDEFAYEDLFAEDGTAGDGVGADEALPGGDEIDEEEELFDEGDDSDPEGAAEPAGDSSDSDHEQLPPAKKLSRPGLTSSASKPSAGSKNGKSRQPKFSMRTSGKPQRR